MRAEEFLKSLIGQSQQSGVTINIGTINIDTSEEAQEPQADEPEMMVPPLQQKIELLKKNAGLDNVYNQQADEDEPLE